MKTTVNMFCTERPAAAEALEPAGAERAPSASSPSGVSGDNPVLELQHLLDIADDTGGPALALQFLNDFFGLQQVRLSRLLADLADGEPAVSVDAVLSLHTASFMAGATDIAEHCATILPFIAARNFTRARVQAAALQQSVDALTAAAPILLEHAEAQLRARTARRADQGRCPERG